MINQYSNMFKKHYNMIKLLEEERFWGPCMKHLTLVTNFLVET